ncbi:MAG: beta-mannosidase, partial [Duncaniella sp.]|nr:beta-mannosidase [Duncaniella sp.]
FYEYVFSLMTEENLFDGCNFWGWGGLAAPADTHWQFGADYTCDPAHEPQGMYSVFATDSTTVGIIRAAARAVAKK